nr:MAG TPA: hypothetical protein [Caudoviricetes sp.]
MNKKYEFNLSIKIEYYKCVRSLLKNKLSKDEWFKFWRCLNGIQIKFKRSK